MNKRHELKYTLSPLEAKILYERIKKVLTRDPNCPENGYMITSLYYDDIFNRAYKEKINGEAIRHKFRLRYYNNDYEHIKLERKSKILSITSKDSVPLTRKESEQLLQNDFEFLLLKEDALYKDLYLTLAHNLHSPKVIVRYQRHAFIHPLGNLRVTFDWNIRTSKTNTNFFGSDVHYIPAIDDQQVIVEVKFNNMLPDHIRDIFQSGHIMQSASSKYVMARQYAPSF